MPIPILVIPALLNALALAPALFVEGVGRQLVRRWFPAGVDKAALDQVILKREELDLRRTEMAAQERKFLHQIEEARKLKFYEIERMREIRRDEANYVNALQKWPLHSIQPDDFLSASAAHNGRALNIIFTVIDTHDGDFYRKPFFGGELINLTMDMFHGSPLRALAAAATRFHGELILYHEVTKSARSSGQSLTSSLWNLLRTEPTVLIEVSVPKPAHLTLSVSHWGGAFDDKAPWVNLAPQDLELPSLGFNPAELPKELRERAVHQGFEEASSLLSLGLASLVVSFGDTYRALHRPHEFPSPVLPKFVQSTGQTLSLSALRPMLAAYTAAYDAIASYNPLLASELTARAAVASHASGQGELADAFLEKALHLNPALAGKTEVNEEMLAHLRQQRGSIDGLLEIEVALRVMREIPIDLHIAIQQDIDARPPVLSARYNSWK